jgi:hypothetical protein
VAQSFSGIADRATRIADAAAVHMGILKYARVSHVQLQLDKSISVRIQLDFDEKYDQRPKF